MINKIVVNHAQILLQELESKMSEHEKELLKKYMTQWIKLRITTWDTKNTIICALNWSECCQNDRIIINILVCKYAQLTEISISFPRTFDSAFGNIISYKDSQAK